MGLLFALLIGFGLTAIIWVVAFSILDEWDRGVTASLAAAFGGAVVFVVEFAFVIPLFAGLAPDYSEGERVGYPVKISRKGIIFKTWEGEMQLGHGEMASLQEPFRFSVVNPALVTEIKAHVDRGSRVKLVYQEWLIQPWREGSSGYEILKVVEVE